MELVFLFGNPTAVTDLVRMDGPWLVQKVIYDVIGDVVVEPRAEPVDQGDVAGQRTVVFASARANDGGVAARAGLRPDLLEAQCRVDLAPKGKWSWWGGAERGWRGLGGINCEPCVAG